MPPLEVILARIKLLLTGRNEIHLKAIHRAFEAGDLTAPHYAMSGINLARADLAASQLPCY